jgi:alanine dehydrogenase
VVSGRAPGRTGTDDIVLYKSVGSALQDLTVAALCARLAGERGAGVSLDARISRAFQEH